MAFVHSKNSYFAVEDSGSTLQDISNYLSSIDFPYETDISEASTMGRSSKHYIAGLKDGTISIEGKWDTVVDGYLFGIIGTKNIFEYGPSGSIPGNIRYTGEVICTSYGTTSDLGDVVTFSAEFQITGDIIRDTFS